MNRRYTTLLIDADDTLLDFHKAEAAAIKAVCDRFGIDYCEEVRRTYSQINDSLWKQFEKGLVTRDIIKLRRFKQFAEYTGSSAPAQQMSDCYIEALSRQGALLEGAEELCRRLSEKYDLYIITNGLAPVQNGRLKRCGLLPFFKDIFISEEVGGQKPDKTFFDAVLARLDEKDKGRICIIGDSMSSDILGGINSGIDTCFYDPAGKKQIYKPTWRAESYEEILKLFM